MGNDSIYFVSKRATAKQSLTILLDTLAALNLDKDYASYKQFLVQFIEKADKLNKMIKNYRKPANDSLAFEQYYNYFNSSIDLIQQCTEISKLPYIKDILPNLPDTLKDYFDVAHSTANMVLSINRRNYASAVVNAVHIYDVVKAKYTNKNKGEQNNEEAINKKVSELVKEANKSTVTIDKKVIDDINKNSEADALSIKNYSEKEIKRADDEITKELIQKASNGQTIKLDNATLDTLRIQKLGVLQNTAADDTLKKLYKYGTFMAAVVQAKSSDDIENVIESFALPTGSARIKRESQFNVSLNAYAGLYMDMKK